MDRTRRTDQQKITTARLVLRPPTDRDAARIAGLIDDEAVVRMLSGPPFPYFMDDARDYVAQVEAEDPTRHRTFAVEHARAGFIGMIGFHTVDDSWPELGYWFGRAYWGCGYATEAAAAAVRWAESAWARRVLGSGHFTDNPASGRVLAKSGFLYTGERRARASAARDQPVETRMMIRLAG